MRRQAAALLGRLVHTRCCTSDLAPAVALTQRAVHTATTAAGAPADSARSSPLAAWGAALVAAAGAAAALPSASADAEPAAGARERRPQQGAPPASGAPAALDERGLTNNPLDYDPITNEHTAAMTLARKQGMEAYDAGRFEEAEAKFLLALSEARQGFPPGDVHIPSVLNLVAEFYRNTRRHEEAARLYQEALDLLSESTGEKHWMFASALVNLALLKEETGDLAAAAQLLERASALRRAMFGPNSIPYADATFSLGRVLRAAAAAEAGSASGAAPAAARRGWFGGGGGGAAGKRQERWLALMAEGVRVLNESGDPAGTPIIEWEMTYADALREAGRHAAAAEQLRSAVEHLAAAKGDAAAQASEVNERLVDALEASGQLPAASAAMRKCAEARMQLFGRHLVVAKSLVRLSRLLVISDRDLGGGRSGGGGRDRDLGGDLERAQLAQAFAGNAVSLAEEAAAGGGGGGTARGGGGGLLSGLLAGGRSGGGGGGGSSQADALAERLRAQLELASALQALASANAAVAAAAAAADPKAPPPAAAGSEGDASVAPLRRALAAARAAAAEGAEGLRKLGGGPAEAEQALDKATGLLVDIQIIQIEILEDLASKLQALAAAGAARRGAPAAPGAGEAGREAAQLLAEAEAVAAALSGA